MDVIAHWAAYAAIVVFVTAVGYRFYKIHSLPIHFRWELYPVPTEGKRAEHGGSRLEEGDWWTKPRHADHVMEMRYMLPEMVLIKALWEHNRKLWWKSFPFHFGLYIVAGFVGLLGLGAVGRLANAPQGALVNLAALTTVVGVGGMVLAILGGLGLLYARLTDEDMKPYTNFSHYFNLIFIVAALALTLAAWWTADRDFSRYRAFIVGLLTGKPAALSSLVSGSIVVNCLLLAYIPLTHMSHFFVKWFTWHRIRWDDEPNVRGGRIEKMIEKALQYRPTWAADHIQADGKKTWVDIAVEDIKR
ncbi:MAG: respiratory nitrate reductase subunit gamma [Candidatus Sumerlaeota bacterium]|nr:respiratory nitrate reductase subunit gamma [Candidatus Sumerlaeota bacterium]